MMENSGSGDATKESSMSILKTSPRKRLSFIRRCSNSLLKMRSWCRGRQRLITSTSSSIEVVQAAKGMISPRQPAMKGDQNEASSSSPARARRPRKQSSRQSRESQSTSANVSTRRLEDDLLLRYKDKELRTALEMGSFTDDFKLLHSSTKLRRLQPDLVEMTEQFIDGIITEASEIIVLRAKSRGRQAGES